MKVNYPANVEVQALEALVLRFGDSEKSSSTRRKCSELSVNTMINQTHESATPPVALV